MRKLIPLFLAAIAVFGQTSNYPGALDTPSSLFVAADKQTKVIWIAMLGVTMLLHIFDTRTGFGLLGMIGAVVALVYLADVRPALRSMQSR